MPLRTAPLKPALIASPKRPPTEPVIDAPDTHPYARPVSPPETIVFAGNCQAVALGGVYARHIAPYLNQQVTILDLHPSLPADLRLQNLQRLRTADIVVEQIFDPPRLLPPNTLPPGTRHAAFPTVAGAFYWPFSQHPHPRNRPGPIVGPDGAYPGEIGCRQLNRLIEQGLPADEAVERYAAMDLAALAHLDRFLHLHLERQKRRDEMAGVATHDFIQARLATERLFLTPGHPNLALFSLVAGQVFETLGVPYSLAEFTLRALRITPFPHDEAPIHPSIAAHLQLGFVDSTTTYRYRHEGRFSFDQFIRRYVAYHWDETLEAGIQLAHGEHPARALPLLREGLRDCPQSVAGWKALGIALSSQGETTAAIEAATRAIELDPADPDGAATAEHIWLRADNLAEAERCACAAIRTFPHAPHSHRILAHILARRGEHTAASVAARWAYGLAPGDPENAAILEDFGRPSIAEQQAFALSVAPAPPPDNKKALPEQETLMTGMHIDFGAEGAGHSCLGEGWSYPEPETTWTLGTQSTIDIPSVDPSQDYALLFSAFPAGAENGRAQRAIFYVNETIVGSLIVRSAITLELLIPSAAFNGNTQATLRIALPDAISPAQLNASTDQRLLALAFRHLTLQPFTQPALPTP